MTRRAELDALRGLLLVLMTITHLPTRYSVYSSQIFGFVSAAEGFVFLSGIDCHDEKYRRSTKPRRYRL